jgi:hypothetical protein
VGGGLAVGGFAAGVATGAEGSEGGVTGLGAGTGLGACSGAAGVSTAAATLLIDPAAGLEDAGLPRAASTCSELTGLKL